MGSHFTDQRSNLDLCPDNCHHRMDEYKKNFQQTEPLVCQPAFTGNHCTRELSYDCGNLRRRCYCIRSARKHYPVVFGWIMVRMETEEFILSFRYSFCNTDDSAVPVYLSQQT